MPTSILDIREDKQIISIGSHLLDKKIADGLPLQSLTLIEGWNSTEKSVLPWRIMYWAMKQGLSVDLFTTGNITKRFVRQIVSMSLDVCEYSSWEYLSGGSPIMSLAFNGTKKR